MTSTPNPNSKHWFNYDILPSTTAVFSYAIGSRKLSDNEQVFFVGAQTVVSCYKQLKFCQAFTYTSLNKNPNRLNRDGALFFLFYPGWMRLMFTCVLWRWVVSTVIISCTGTFRRALTASLDSCAGDKECPFSGVTKSGRVWRKVPESDARSVTALQAVTKFVSKTTTAKHWSLIVWKRHF